MNEECMCGGSCDMCEECDQPYCECECETEKEDHDSADEDEQDW